MPILFNTRQNGALENAPCTILQHNFYNNDYVFTYYPDADRVVYNPEDSEEIFDTDKRFSFGGKYCAAVWRCKLKINKL